MAEAMKKTIQTTGIAMLAGETAVLGQSPEAAKIYTETKKIVDAIQNVLDEHEGGRGTFKH